MKIFQDLKGISHNYQIVSLSCGLIFGKEWLSEIRDENYRGIKMTLSEFQNSAIQERLSSYIDA
jgi:hypothetical protein